ncbi:MAG: class I SAM-dependent methyltransferase [Candidatus Hodarchaeota archaeon]
MEGILSILNLEPNAVILDLCCGHGRHSLALAKHGFQMTGLDLSELHIQLAREAAAEHGLDINWLRRDMRDIPEELESSFDAIINIFGAFGYLESVEEDITVLKGVWSALKSNGKFLMETINRECIIRNYQPRDWYYTSNGVLVLEERNLDLATGRSHVKVHIIDEKGNKKIQQHAMRLYSLSEMASLFASAGLIIQDVFGAFDKRPYAIDAPKMIILATKS